VEVVASAHGRLDAWVDFNGDGSWAGVDEQVFSNRVLVDGTNRLTFLVPGGAPAANTYARFRFSTAGGLSFNGPAADGEVEDYAVTLDPVADLAVTMAAAPDPVAAGSNLTYSIVVTNGGPSPAANLTLTNLLPSAVNFVSALASQGGCSASGGLVSCTLGSIASGGSVMITMLVTPSSPGSFSDAVGVSSATFDGNPANNTAITTSTVLTAPQITGVPQSVTTTNGSTATFVVTATGSPILGYQWRFNGADIPGGDGLALVIANVQLANAGNYSVRVSNAVGVVESAAVALTVLVPPAVTSPPQSRMELAGATANFSVVATGTAPLGFQWFLNDTNALAGATNATLTLTNLQLTQAGSYRVSVGNSAGFLLSGPAVLTIVPMDLGDAPDPGYPTLLANNGARHRILPGVALGVRVDFEPDGQPNAAASGDDVASPDDEDGVTFNTP